MRRAIWAALLALGGFGCSNVQVVQRDGCWVRRTESFPKNVKEEIGVCARPQPVWSNDRVARLAQECMAEADYRWQNEALAAWNAGQPLPPQRSEHQVMQQCMSEAATTVVAENEQLKKQLAEARQERDAMRDEAAQDRQNLRESQTHMTDALGEAAKRPAPNAFATANSNGSASTRSDQQTATPSPVMQAEPPPAVVPLPIVEAPPAAPPAPAPAPKRARTKKPAECALPAPGGRADPACAPDSLQLK